MGFAALRRLSTVQLQRRIQGISKDTSKVIMTVHAKKRLVQRKMNMLMVYECLQLGRILQVPEENHETGSLECRMERYIAGKNCCVVAAVRDEDPDVVCVTVWLDG